MFDFLTAEAHVVEFKNGCKPTNCIIISTLLSNWANISYSQTNERKNYWHSTIPLLIIHCKIVLTNYSTMPEISVEDNNLKSSLEFFPPKRCVYQNLNPNKEKFHDTFL